MWWPTRARWTICWRPWAFESPGAVACKRPSGLFSFPRKDFGLLPPTIRYGVGAAVLLLVAAGSFFLGVRHAKTDVFAALLVQLEAVQAELGHNHLVQYRELESDLSRGCADEALAKVRFAVDAQMRVLASFQSNPQSNWAKEAIAKADPTLPAQLRSYKSPYGDSWKKPTCSR